MSSKLKGLDPKAAKGIIERHEQEADDKAKVTLYLSRGVYKRLQKACGKAPVSPVIEDVLRSYLDLIGE